MSGVAVIRYLLANNLALTAVVPAERITGGVIALGTDLPAISITQIDGVPRLNVEMVDTKRMITERVQVTVDTKNYPDKKSILTLVRQALPISKGTINGVICDSVLPDVLGPDLDDPETQIFSQSRDFIVKWHEQ